MVSARWFPQKERVTATAFGMVGHFIETKLSNGKNNSFILKSSKDVIT